jgi:hypothetical protein
MALVAMVARHSVALVGLVVPLQASVRAEMDSEEWEAKAGPGGWGATVEQEEPVTELVELVESERVLAGMPVTLSPCILTRFAKVQRYL